MSTKLFLVAAFLFAISSNAFASKHLAEIDSVWESKKNKVDFLFGVKTANYKDLGPLETVTLFEGSSSHFKITSLPKWDFNRVYIQVEPTDGRELNGYLYAGDFQSIISGWSTYVALDMKVDFPVTFELAFPEYRKVKLKWWAMMEYPQAKYAQMEKRTLGGDSIEASYTFLNSTNSSSNHKVSLKFNKGDFVDGQIPTVKMFEFNPDGILKMDSLKAYSEIGNIYEIHAELRSIEPITFALPLDFDYHPGTDSVILMHQMNGQWIDVPADSIINGFVYFKTNSFSKWGEKKIIKNIFTDIVTTFACSHITQAGSFWIEECRDAQSNIIEDIKIAGSAIKKMYDKLKEIGANAACLDFDGFSKLFEKEREKGWPDIGEGKLDFNDSLTDISSNYADVLNILKQKRNAPLQKINDACKEKNFLGSDTIGLDKNSSEICQWQVTKSNLDILLADAIVAKTKGEARRFTNIFYNDKDAEILLFENDSSFSSPQSMPYIDIPSKHHINIPLRPYIYRDYFKITSPFVNSSGWFIKGLQSCLNFTNSDGILIQKWIDFGNSLAEFGSSSSVCHVLFNAFDIDATALENLENGIDCTNFSAQYLLTNNRIMANKDDKLISISEAMVRVSLLAWIDKTVFRDFLHFAYQRTYDGIHDWLVLADPFLFKNNIIAKADASLALFEYIFTGESSKLQMLNEALKIHYGENGGYSEGMGYSQYIWDDVPYVLSALKDAYSANGQQFKIEENFLKSPDYIFEFSRPVGKDSSYYGFIPVEVDDGCTYNPDYRVWAKLKNDSKYLKMSEYAPLRDDEKKNVLVPFGFPNKKLYESEKKLPKRGKLWGSNKDGLLMITAVRGDSTNADTVALSMIAEKGDMWEKGQAHDQQDNLSITLKKHNLKIKYLKMALLSKTGGIPILVKEQIKNSIVTKTIMLLFLMDMINPTTSEFPAPK